MSGLYTSKVFAACLRNAKKLAAQHTRPIGVRWIGSDNPQVNIASGYWGFEDSKDWLSEAGLSQQVSAVVMPNGTVKHGTNWDESLVIVERKRTRR